MPQTFPGNWRAEFSCVPRYMGQPRMIVEEPYKKAPPVGVSNRDKRPPSPPLARLAVGPGTKATYCPGPKGCRDKWPGTKACFVVVDPRVLYICFVDGLEPHFCANIFFLCFTINAKYESWRVYRKLIEVLLHTWNNYFSIELCHTKSLIGNWTLVTTCGKCSTNM